MRSAVIAALLFGSLAPVGSPAAWAAPVRGTVTLPQDLKLGRKYSGYWRLENGILPAQPPPSRGDTVVVLSGVKGEPPPARTMGVEISGFQALPSTVIVGEGSVVELRNSDRVAHDLSLPELTSLMPIERLAPGGIRRQKFLTAGGYAIRCAEYPHLVASVVVVNSPFFAVVDDKGAFKLPDAPDGKATIRIWSHGRWVLQEEIEVGPKSGDLRLKVKAAPAAKAAPAD